MVRLPLQHCSLEQEYQAEKASQAVQLKSGDVDSQQIFSCRAVSALQQRQCRK